MRYTLLTGATGLVGRHVLREFLQAGVPVVTLVRPGKGAGVLAGIIGNWEAEVGRLLPRPIVIEGDLNHEAIIPDERDRRWLAAHCDTILHSAASMTFREDRRGEPFRTNVEGTNQLLELCRAVGIRRFHQVSTAYICGLRQGKILETDIDVGQILGNVYEQSKLQAEKMIRGAGWIDELTIYRPASVVGDSHTGYVTNFHGFYLPLQLAHVTAPIIPVREMNARFFSKLGLRGDEGKNLVPVDWLARAIFELFLQPKHHGQTYHLASPNPVPVVELQRVIRDAIEQFYPRKLATSISEKDLAEFEAKFVDHMEIYRSHWRDDPKFDVTNTVTALPHLPCPNMTYDVLMRIAKYPIERNFNAPRHEAPAVPFDVAAQLASLLEGNGAEAATAAGTGTIGLQVNGPGGGEWSLQWDGERVIAAERGIADSQASRLYVSAKTLGRLADRSLSVEQAFNSGRLVAEGMNGRQGQLKQFLTQVVFSATLNHGVSTTAVS